MKKMLFLVSVCLLLTAMTPELNAQNNNREYAFVMLSGIIDIQYMMATPDGMKPFMILNVEKYGQLDDPDDDTTKNVIVKMEYTEDNYKAVKALQADFKPFWVLYEKVSLRKGNWLPVGKGDDGDNLVYSMGDPVKFNRKCVVTIRDMQKYYYSRLDYIVQRRVWFKYGFWSTKKYFFQIEGTKIKEVEDNGQRIFKNEVLYVPDTKENRKKLITQSMENSFFLNTYILYTTKRGCIDIEPKKNSIPINVVTNFSPIPGNTGIKDNKLLRVKDPWDNLYK